MEMIAGEMAKAAVKLVADVIKDRISRKSSEDAPTIASIEGHLHEVLKWSDRDQFFGMSAANSVDESTVALDLHTEPRRFRALADSAGMKKEGDLLSDGENYVLLGEPGSGKTTTLKRIARMLLLQDPQSTDDAYQYPVVLRLRQIKHGSSLITSLAEALGIGWELVVIEDDRVGTTKRTLTKGGKNLLDAVAEFLSDTGAVVLLDGLDELDPDSRPMLEGEVASLGLKLSNSKIILSTRAGDYARQIDGFNTVEICPLTTQQVEAIIQRWTPNASDFLGQLSALPYHDLADRPLLLTQLLFLYSRYGYLPEQPSSIYERLVNLLLQEWDAQRGVIRKSKYSGFTTERKAGFLAALAYQITYRMQAKSFSGRDLVLAYREIHRLFNLPETEAHLVTQEIQSHSGIIAVGRADNYEFSHLSLQEYLCAQYLVREPFPEAMESYLASYTPPLAVAVALSSNPGNWFGGIILKESNFGALTSESLNILLRRLVLERPSFGKSVPAGLAICKLYCECRPGSFPHGVFSQNLYESLAQLAEREDVVESIAASLLFFKVDPANLDDYMLLRRRLVYSNQYGIETPRIGLLPRGLLRRVWDVNPSCLVWEDSKGSLRPFTF